ncbi:MAG: hypothetical protein COV74_00340 [Candidatus Omnitrophica bacterium CG11_big_fil_rev_8_21_14_0_20_45_26]|uniref:Uncharacterized protein n=1 Tax=Candidatus Abzuiibacterium crystallinum TaxID=1974748 RepID=A0A2H0LVM3_9BACT|nr:MAG: hypothetical protein COV74_00340 [Candidatus Omnitrophica bacterium CG11_big_fil_rev_8_21_14_0_20_45_26]PIW64613.1 MAG: hypothetical protein COW12_05440 [Candidatus Omnitrophica bacterium CG12_big_fil_rev_8_21_14_0_65_45_16]
MNQIQAWRLLWNSILVLTLFIFFILTFTPRLCLTAENQTSPIDAELAGVKLGSRTEELLKLYPSIYKHQLMLGEYLYEACNQQNQEVFTFEEGPWSRGYITSILMRVEEDVTVCRDETGALPDFAIPAITPQGVRFGDSREKILEVYGNP